MFDPGRDQASGLRRMFAARRDVRVLPIAGHDRSGAQALFVVNFAAALARLGRRTLVLDGERGMIAPTLGLKARYDLVHLLAGERRFDDVAMPTHEGFRVMPAARGLAEIVRHGVNAERLFAGFAGLTEPFQDVILYAGADTVAELLAHRAQEATLLCGTDARQLAATYSRIKSMRQAYGFTRFRVVYHQAESPSAAAACHERLAGAAGRFLHASVAFGGAVEDERAFRVAERAHASVFTVAASSDAARAFERIAASSFDWPSPTFGAPRPLLH